MHRHSTNTASFFSVLIVALIFSLSLARVAAAQGNTSLGEGALFSNTTGDFNTAIGFAALTMRPKIITAGKCILVFMSRFPFR